MLFALIFFFSSPTLAQDLFLKKGGTSESGEKKAAPLFLNTNPTSEKKAPAAKPLFLDQPANPSHVPGGLFNPIEKRGKIFALKQKDPNELAPIERMELAMEETRLANLDSIRRQSLETKSRTAAALAKWEADTAAEKARQAALEPAVLTPAATEPTAEEKPKPTLKKLAPPKPPENTGPKPVFNTVR